jgi:hypothetical protein
MYNNYYQLSSTFIGGGRWRKKHYDPQSIEYQCSVHGSDDDESDDGWYWSDCSQGTYPGLDDEYDHAYSTKMLEEQQQRLLEWQGDQLRFPPDQSQDQVQVQEHVQELEQHHDQEQYQEQEQEHGPQISLTHHESHQPHPCSFVLPIIPQQLSMITNSTPPPKSPRKVFKVIGKKCGRFTAQISDIHQLQNSQGLFQGSVIDLLAEYMCRAAGKAGHAHHLSTLIMYFIFTNFEKDIHPTHDNSIKWELEHVRFLFP